MPCKRMMIFLIFLVIPSLACEESYTFENRECTFDFQYPNNNCNSNFTFYKCNFELDGQNFTQSSWRLCTVECCYSKSNFVQNRDGIQKCQQSINKHHRIELIEIYGGSFGGIVVIILLFIWLCRWGCCGFCYQYCPTSRRSINRLNTCLKNTFICKCLRNRHQQPINPRRVNQLSSDNIQNFQSHSTWIQAHLSEQKLNSECTVCLEIKPSFQLQCGHIFHRQCIIQCIIRKEECIICRSKQFHTVHIYCERCFDYYYEANLTNYNVFLYKTTQTCPNCREKSNHQ